jgi:homoserine kinase type II
VALLTPLDEAAARAVLGRYGLSLERVTPLPAHGTVNSNFRVEASGARWFLRVNEGKALADAEAEARLVARLREGGLPTPAPRPTAAGALVTEAAGKPVTLFPWLDGREAAPDPARPETVRVCGEALARLHAAAEALPREAAPRNHYTLDALARRLDGFAADPRFAGVAPLLREELVRAGARDRGPEGLIHQDLFPDNVLVDGGGNLVAVLDLEQATWGPLAYDLAVCLNSWCWDGERVVPAAAQALVDAYAAVRPIEAAVRARLEDEARLAAARFTITRITDVFLPEGVDEDLRRRKDWRDYARRLTFFREVGMKIGAPDSGFSPR